MSVLTLIALSPIRLETSKPMCTHASSNRWTKYASVASCNARIALLCHLNPAPVLEPSYALVIKSSATSRTTRANGSLEINKSVER